MIQRRRGRHVPALALALLFTSPVGCALGPKALERTHGPYNDSVRRVYEEQLLRNLVRIRYNEAPAALDVSGIAAQYELAGQAEARPFFIAPNPSNSNVIFRTFTSILPDVQANGSNRPTITFNPVDSAGAVRQFLTPIPQDTLILLMETGWPVVTILRLWVERLNGVPNAPPVGSPTPCDRADVTRFERIAELAQIAHDRDLVSVQAEEHTAEVSGALPAESVTAAAAVEAAKSGLEYRQRPDGKTWVVVRKSRRLVLRVHGNALGSPEVAELLALLHLVPGLPQYELVAEAGVPDPLLHGGPPTTQLRYAPRSTAQVYGYLANGVEVPPEHFRCGLVQPTPNAEGCLGDGRAATRGLFEVHVSRGCRAPKSAYIATKYRGYWYYIDDADAASKATLADVLLLSRLDFGQQRLSGPLLTLPVSK
jgi:hypothetical protein